MAVPAAKLAIIVNADVDQATRALGSLDRRLDKSARNASSSVGHIEKETRRGGGALRGFGTGLATVAKTGAIATAAVGGGLYVGVRKTVGAFQEAEKIAAQTGAVLKSTGGAANVSAKHINDLAGKLSMLSGADDEAIQSGENLLLTFTKIRNEQGKGNKIFDRATRTMLDMSVALGQDTKSSAIQLGKALNDPIKGVTALQRVGVSFDKGQRDQIKTLVEHGKTLEAQKMILRELNTEFGGSAKAAGDTTAGSFAKLQVSVGNLAEAIGGKLAPYLAEAADWLTKLVNTFTSGSSVPGQFAAQATGALETVKSVFSDAYGVVKQIIDTNRPTLESIGRTISDVANKALDGLKRIASAFSSTFGAGSGFGADIRNIISKLIGFADTVGKIVGPGVKKSIDGIVQMWQGFAQSVRGVIRVISGLLSGDFSKVWSGLKDIVGGTFKGIVGQIKTYTAPIRAAAEAVGGAVSGALRSAWESLKGIAVSAFNRLIGGIRSKIQGASKAAADIATTVWNAVKSLPQEFVEIGKHVIQGLIDGIKSKANDLLGIAGKIAHWAADPVAAGLELGSPSKLFRRYGQWVGEGFGLGIESMGSRVSKAVDKGLMFPLEAKLRELQAKADKLQNLANGSSSRSSLRAGGGLEWAKSMVGHFKESAGTNRGPELDQLQKKFGHQAAEWCAMFATEAVVKAGGSKKLLTASVANIRQWAMAGTNGLMRGVKSTPKVGDLAMRGNDHIGIVESVRNGKVHTIEGNTSAGKVARRTNSISAYDYARPNYGSAMRAAGMSVSGGSSKLTRGQKAFGATLAKLTGLNSDVIASWIFGEMNGGAAKAREKAKNNNWLNIGYTDKGPLALTRDKLWRDPIKAAKATAQFLRGKKWGASQGIQDIMDTAGRGSAAQRAAIISSGWASGAYHGSLNTNLGRNPFGRVMGGDGGSISDMYGGLVKVNDQQQKAIQKAIAFRDAIKNVAGQVSDNLGRAVEKFQEKWERTKGAAFDEATRQLIANSPAARELAALQAQSDEIQRQREDAANQKALADAMASGDQGAIADAQFQIDETARQRRIAELQEQAAKEQEQIEASRAEERDKAYATDLAKFEENEKKKTGNLVSQLAARTITYAQFVKRVNRILKAIGADTFEGSAEDEGALLGGFSAKQLKALGITPAEYKGILTQAGQIDLPSFDGGGYVPGRRGQPVPILAHGGEEVLTPEQQRSRGVVVDQRHYGDVIYQSQFDMQAEDRRRAFELQNALRMGR